MKRLVIALLLLILSAAWLYLSFLRYEGLNSIQRLSAYNDGFLSKKPLTATGRILIHTEGANAQIYVDTLGIPQIFARDINSVAYAIGYMHARDRYFQMELLAYSMMGRLSEIIGTAGLRSDRRWKVFDLEKKAEEMLDSIRVHQPEIYAYLDAYARGVNAYIAKEDKKHRDPVYDVWNYSPGPWKACYSFLVQWYMSSNLTFYDDYVNRQEILDKLPEPVRAVLYPVHTAGHSTIIPARGSFPALTPSPAGGLVRIFDSARVNNYASRPFNSSLGSNNWVVGKQRTKNGEVFLCNDLHLALMSPNVFYEVQVNGPSLHAYGFSIPGVPVIVTGHNESVAWGITNGEWDVTEQYYLKTDPSAKDNYWLDGRWKKMTSRTFMIRVKDHAPEKITARYSIFGPVVNMDSIVYGLRWHPAGSAWAVCSFYKLMVAAGWNDFREALRDYDYPSQNFVYADTGSHIGISCAGKMPLKPLRYDGGMLDGTHIPEERIIPFDSLPQSYDPEQHYLFSANQEPCIGSYYYSSRWVSDLYRPGRIDELLGEHDSFTREDMRQMQLDVTDISVKDVQHLLSRYANGNLPIEWEKIRQWDGQLGAGRQQAFFYKCFREATRKLSRELAGKLQVRMAPSFDQFMNFLLHYDSVTVRGQTFYSRDYFLRLLDSTEKTYIHYTSGKTGYPDKAFSFVIPQLTFLPGLAARVVGAGGSDNTINVNYGAHPVIRTLIELKDGSIRSWMVNAIGQTGRMNNRNYFQQLPDWEGNRLHRTQFTKDPGSLKAIDYTIILSDKIQ